MKPDKNKDIIERMAEVLRKHSLPYEEGAWERFKEFEKTKRKKVVLWPYFTGAAAVLLLAITLFLNDKGIVGHNEPTRIAKVEVPIEKESLENKKIEKLVSSEKSVNSSDEIRNRKLTANNLAAKSNLINQDQSNNSVTTSEHFLTTSRQLNVNQASLGQQTEIEQGDLAAPSLKDEPISKIVENPLAVTQTKKDKAPFTDDFFNDKAYAESAAMDNNSSDVLNKWNFSIEVSPNIKEKNVNFGGGLAVAYNLNKRISISSGISYMQLDAQRGPNQLDIPAEFSKASLSSYNYNKSLNAVNTSLVGLDIPVNVKFNLNNNMYASAGVSVFSVLNESRHNEFEEHVAVLAYSSPNSISVSAPEPLMRTVYTKETSENTPYQGKNFTGFFNFSVGYKLPFLQKLNLAVEPYLKIPVGSLSEEDMDLSNGGLKIITSF